MYGLIGGNVVAEIQTQTTTRNEIGEAVKSWQTVQRIKGYLDLLGGDSKYLSYNTKLRESTHVFVADYVKLNPTIKEETSRMVVKNKIYDILLIDNPMELDNGSQLEFSLKYTGGEV